jgi:hypothetical protein
MCIYVFTPRLQVNAARDERIKEIETQTQLELEAKDAEVAGLQARPTACSAGIRLELCSNCSAGEAEEGDGVRGTAAQAGGGAVGPA